MLLEKNTNNTYRLNMQEIVRIVILLCLVLISIIAISIKPDSL